MNSATAFAPATVANVGVGFDILGFPIETVGDRVTVSRSEESGKVEITEIQGITGLPLDSKQNTATVGLIRLCKDRSLGFGFRVSINKGIPMSSGLGGSAASAVASIVAASALLDEPLTEEEMLSYALDGEAVASGARHADNLAPCLLGGMIGVRSLDPLDLIRIPTPSQLLCIVLHPDLQLSTRSARGILKAEISLKSHIQQSANLVGLIAACFRNDLGLLQRSLEDVIIEPQRSHLIPGFESVKKEAMRAGALACSISGAGPSIFAFAASSVDASRIKETMVQAFSSSGIRVAHDWISPIRMKGASLI